MIQSFIIAGIASYMIGQVKLPSCILGAENQNYCISRQYANFHYENIEFVKKLNTNPNDTRIIIKLKKYGTISIPYDTNKLTFEYHVNF